MAYTLSHKVGFIRAHFLCSSLSAIRNAKFRSKFTESIVVQTVQLTKAIDTPHPQGCFTCGLQGNITCIFFLKISFI